jgi:hypothetical protein
MASNGRSPTGAVVRPDPVAGEVERVRAGLAARQRWLAGISLRRK